MCLRADRAQRFVSTVLAQFVEMLAFGRAVTGARAAASGTAAPSTAASFRRYTRVVGPGQHQGGRMTQVRRGARVTA